MSESRRVHQLADYVLALYAVFFIAMIWLAREELPDARTLLLRVVGLLLAYFGGLRFLAWRGAGPMAMDGFRAAGLVFAVPFLFLSLGRIPEIINPRSYEAELQAIDRALFGVDPVHWMEQFLHPLAVDWFQIAYTAYYPLFLVGLALLFKREHHHFNAYLGAIALTVFIAFMGYFLVPARSPYYAARMPEFADLFRFTIPVRGVWIGEFLAHALDSAETIKVDCFPSGHTAGAVLVMLATWRWRRRIFWMILPLALSLIFATVYLRYHYVIDLVAGAMLAAASFRTAIYLNDRLASVESEVSWIKPRRGRQELR
jgi:membrane-associated phospholipid phosphatase